ncbi:flagellar basal-body rod protein FlgB [Salmonella enterica subsp. enterica]|nr:flagellar basal-body rod protein FlgB [Salmonella enterica subsp. enterica] [Salmonella enterica subsp. enterica serovar Menston]
MTGFYPCEASINAINSDAFCVYSGDNARVKAFKLSAEFCHLRRRYARQARCRLTISAEALNLRAQRQEILAANIANADTPGYQARDIDFASELKKVMVRGREETGGVALTSDFLSPYSRPGGLCLPAVDLLYRVPDQPSLDGNT